jgi:hypothetical protein
MGYYITVFIISVLYAIFGSRRFIRQYGHLDIFNPHVDYLEGVVLCTAYIWVFTFGFVIIYSLA